MNKKYGYKVSTFDESHYTTNLDEAEVNEETKQWAYWVEKEILKSSWGTKIDKKLD